MKTIKKIIGWLLITSPFIGLFIFATLELSIWIALLIYGGVAFLFLLFHVGINLITQNQ